MTDTFVRLLLVRHAEAVANTDLRYLGTRDDPLTERGRGQATRLAQALALLPIAAVYTSSLRRAMDTATPIADACGVAPTIDDRLREGAFGDWEGLTRAEVLASGPEAAELHRRWEADTAVGPPNGESFAAIQGRVLACVAVLADAHPGASIVLVSHVGAIKALLCAALGVPLVAAQRMFLDGATISVVDWGSGAAPWGAPSVLRLFNAHPRLGWESAEWLRR